MIKRTVMILGMAMLMSTTAQAGPVVDFSVSGSSGSYLLDFSVTNTLGATNLDIYMFGIEGLTGDIAGVPADWYEEAPMNTSWDGGPDILFTVTWQADTDAAMIQNGETVSGFTFNVTSASAPTSVRWFAYAYDWVGGGTAVYSGSDSFTHGGNPSFAGFTGYAPTGGSAVPEPSTMLLFGSGLLGLAGLKRRRRV